MKNTFDEVLEPLELTKDEINSLEHEMFNWYEKHQPKLILPRLIEKYLNQDNPLGDLAKDCVEDKAIGPYIKDGLEPEDFFNYIANVCCDACFENALEPLRKEYNEIVGKTSPYKLFKIRGESRYEYAWGRIYMKSSPICKVFYLKKFKKK